MPNYPIETGKYMGRNNPGLIRSSGDAPSEFWVTDPTLPVLFQYKYTSSSNKNVVIPKGLILSVAAPVYDRRLRRSYPAITIANGTNNPAGVAMTTIFERLPEDFGGYQPTIVTRNYIQVQMLSNKTTADAFSWGCTYGVAVGDFVKPDAKGHFAKWLPNKVNTEAVADFNTDGSTTTHVVVVKEPIKPGTTVTAAGKKGVSAEAAAAAESAAITAALTNLYTITLTVDASTYYDEVTVTYTSQISDPIEQRIGQVLATEGTTNPEGFLQYLIDDPIFQEIADGRDEYSAKTAEPSFFKGEMKYWENLYKGVTHLTDGKVIGKKDVSLELLNWPGAKAGDPTFPADFARTGWEIFTIAHTPISPDHALKVEVFTHDATTGGTALREGVDFRLDYQNGIIHIYSTADYAGKDIRVTYSHYESAIPGLPTDLDIANGVGAARILLKF